VVWSEIVNIDPSSEIHSLVEEARTETSIGAAAPASSASTRRSAVSLPRRTLPSGAMSSSLTNEGVDNTIRRSPESDTAYKPSSSLFPAVNQISRPSGDHATPRTLV
jgi:hypothetical protein